MTEPQNPQNPVSNDSPPTPGIDEATPGNLAELLELGTETVACDISPSPLPPKRWRRSSAGIVFSLVVVGFVVAVGWWSWRMLEMGAGLREQSKASPAELVDIETPRIASPWETVTTLSIPTDGRFIALEAALNRESTTLLATFSDGSTRVYPLADGVLGQAQVLEDARAYPLAVTFGPEDRPRLITQDGKAIQTFDRTDGTQTEPIDPLITEIYCWTPNLLVSAPNPFDGSIMVQRDDTRAIHDSLKLVGTGPNYNRLVVADRSDLTRVGVLDLTDHSVHLIATPAKIHHAALSPMGKQITAVLADGTIACFNAVTGTVQWRRDQVPGKVGHSHVIYTPSGEIIIAEDRLLLLAPADGGVLADITPDSDFPLAVFDMKFSADGRHLIVLGNDLHLLTHAR